MVVSSRRRDRWIRGAAIALIGFAASHAMAQSASVQAQSLFDDGRKLIQAGKIAEACAAFEASQKLDPAVTTLLNLAECREQNRQLATAWGTFVEAGRLARASNNDKLARVAANHARKLEPRLSRLTISVPEDRRIPGLEVLRGSDPVNPAGWNHALPIDGGTYTISARAPGRATWSTTKTIKPESDAQVIEVPRLTEPRPTPVATATPPAPQPPATTTAKPAPPPVPPPATKPAPTPPPTAPTVATPRRDDAVPPPRSVARRDDAAVPTRSSPIPASPETRALPGPAVDQPGGRSVVVPLVVGAAAVGLGGAALAFHLSGNNLYDRARMAQTQQAQDSLYQSANTRRYLAEGFGVAAVGCAGVAIYLYVSGRGESSTMTALTPIASPQLAGFALSGRW